MTATLRLLIDSALDGPTNMARDEALLERAAAGDTPATLRFYQWSAPTISLGYFQPYSEFEAITGPVRKLPVVRRTTGGGAILHDRELTYALAVPSPHPLLAKGPTALYARMHDAIIKVLQDLGIPARQRGESNGWPTASAVGDTNSADEGSSSSGEDSSPPPLEQWVTRPGERWHGSAAPRNEGQQTRAVTRSHDPFFCFARAHPLDIVVGTMKLAGSAQRRVPTGVLQHGSIILDAVHAEQPSAGVAQYCQTNVESLARRIADRFAAGNDLVLLSDTWEAAELQQAGAHTARYNSPAWTRRMGK